MRVRSGRAPRPLPERHPRASLLLLLVGLAAGMLACSGEAESEMTDDPREVARVARMQVYREGIPDFAEQVCRKHATLETEYGPACLKAAADFLEAVAKQVERAPVTWEKQAVALGGICQREAFRFAQSEAEGRSEPDLLVVGLLKGPACLEYQYGLLKELALREGQPTPEN